MYEGWENDAEKARALFRWTGGAVRLVEEIDDPIVRRRAWGHAEKDRFTVPFLPDLAESEVGRGPWVWRYGTASAGTGSRYAALVTRVHADVGMREGGPSIATVLAPWQDAYPVAVGGWLDESYVAEKLTAGRGREGRLHGGDLAALTMLLRILLGREEVSDPESKKDE